MQVDKFWKTLQEEAVLAAKQEPLLSSLLHSCILNHQSLQCALSFIIANKLSDNVLSFMAIQEIFDHAYARDSSLEVCASQDMQAVLQRDPAMQSYLTVLLYLKGVQALQTYRISNFLWKEKRYALALFLQSRNSQVFGVDIHPACQIGKGIMLDHATGIVIGETAVVADDVSILQSVTLGGTGKETGKRHPIVRKGVLLGAGAKILGNIEIGEGAKVGAGSVVLQTVPPHTTVVGNPARIIGRPKADMPSLKMEQNVLEDKFDEWFPEI